MTGIDFHSDLPERPEAIQLLYSLKKYMNSEDFSPHTEMSIEKIEDLFIK